MSDVDQERFTLDEARPVLARKECSESWHQWEVITVRELCDAFDRPISVECSRCGEAHAVEVAGS